MIHWLVNAMIASMIFFPVREFSWQPAMFGLRAEDAWCQTEDGVRIHGWFIEASAQQNGARLPPPQGLADPPRFMEEAVGQGSTTPFDGKGANFCLLFFHGNADNISIRLPKAKEWVERGVSVLLVDYRGYGKSEGNIKTGDDLSKDAEAALQWLETEKAYPPSQLILYGESIGAAPAIELATRERFKTVILEAPFTSIKELAKHHYGWVPDFLLKDFRLDNESKISQLISPLFILHGAEDEIVPLSMGKRLFEKAPQPKQFLEIPSAHHNDISSVGGKNFFDQPFRFAIGANRSSGSVNRKD